VLLIGYSEELGPQVGGSTAGGIDAVCLKPLDVPQLLAKGGHLSG
jgi:hypothetical protein